MGWDLDITRKMWVYYKVHLCLTLRGLQAWFYVEFIRNYGVNVEWTLSLNRVSQWLNCYAKSLHQHLSGLSLGSCIKGLLQKAVLLDMIRIVTRFFSLVPWPLVACTLFLIQMRYHFVYFLIQNMKFEVNKDIIIHQYIYFKTFYYLKI